MCVDCMQAKLIIMLVSDQCMLGQWACACACVCLHMFVVHGFALVHMYVCVGVHTFS